MGLWADQEAGGLCILGWHSVPCEHVELPWMHRLFAHDTVHLNISKWGEENSKQKLATDKQEVTVDYKNKDQINPKVK